MNQHDEAYYIRETRCGNTVAFAFLVDKYKQPVFSMLLRIVRNREDAEELAQDVFVKLFQTIRTFQGHCSFATWVYRITYNLAISHCRKKRPEIPWDEEILSLKTTVSAWTVSEEDCTEEELFQQLDRAMHQLAPDEQALISLYYMGEKSIEEVAAICELSAANVKIRLYRIRKKLYVLLNAMEE